ncbi:hypothetical protein PGIGA_G00116910 [Pangasianodon gigas]|uniref:Uncharacterized protein n=1 Tax=Pangasianodon gigas TaxID=30993 RepID=A0ACC5XFR6_PANGG|nr:hypothetical protein [Pangasianodon gigas]
MTLNPPSEAGAERFGSRRFQYGSERSARPTIKSSKKRQIMPAAPVSLFLVTCRRVGEKAPPLHPSPRPLPRPSPLSPGRLVPVDAPLRPKPAP